MIDDNELVVKYSYRINSRWLYLASKGLLFERVTKNTADKAKFRLACKVTGVIGTDSYKEQNMYEIPIGVSRLIKKIERELASDSIIKERLTQDEDTEVPAELY